MLVVAAPVQEAKTRKRTVTEKKKWEDDADDDTDDDHNNEGDEFVEKANDFKYHNAATVDNDGHDEDEREEDGGRLHGSLCGLQ